MFNFLELVIGSYPFFFLNNSVIILLKFLLHYSSSDPSGVGPKDCGLDPFVIIHDRCAYVDQQVLKIQESPDFLPVGDLPRHITVYLDRSLFCFLIVVFII